MKHQKEIEWLYEQLPVLKEKGILSEDAILQLKVHYGDIKKPEALNWLYIIGGTLGALLIGIGILAIFSHNWENYSQVTRTILSFFPLVIAQGIYGYTLLKKQDSLAWIEGSSTFLMLMLAASMSLISRTFHIQGSEQHFLQLWMCLTIPLIYLSRNTLVTLFYLLGIAYWTTIAHTNGGDSVLYWFFLAAAVPHLYQNTDPKVPTIRSNILGWGFALSFVYSLTWVWESKVSTIPIIGMALTFSTLYLSGKYFYRGPSLWIRPFQTTAILCTWAMALYFSTEWDMSPVHLNRIMWGFDYYSWAAFLNFGIILGFIGIIVAGHFVLPSRGFKLNTLISMFPLFAFAGVFMGQYHMIIPVFLFNIYLLLLGIYYIRKGILFSQLSFINAGIFCISTLILFRFFDADFNTLIKGIAFIITGVIFLIVNSFIAKSVNR